MPTQPKTCSRCRARPASTLHAAYCKPCRAAYQREWRARKRGDLLPQSRAPFLPEGGPRVRLRGTPTRAEMLRYGLV